MSELQLNPNISAEIIKRRSNVNKLPDERSQICIDMIRAREHVLSNLIRHKTKEINKRRDKYLLHPSSLFLCTCILGGRLILSCRTPLKMTFGGSFSPFAFTASATVKLCLSAPQVVIGTVLFPVNSSVRVAGNSNRIGVSSMLMMWLSGYSQRLRALTTNW